MLGVVLSSCIPTTNFKPCSVSLLRIESRTLQIPQPLNAQSPQYVPCSTRMCLRKKNRQTNGTPILKTLHTTQLCLMFLNCVCVCFNFCLQGISNSWSCMRHSGIPPSEDWAIHMREIDPASMSFVCELVFLFFVSIELGSQILEPSRKGFDPSLNEFLTHLAF